MSPCEVFENECEVFEKRGVDLVDIRDTSALKIRLEASVQVMESNKRRLYYERI